MEGKAVTPIANMNKRKIGIIGAGSIVETNHLPAIKSVEDLEIAWIYDRNQRRTDLLSKMYGIGSCGEDTLQGAVAEVDICLLAIPYGVRKPYIDLCRQLEKSMVIEKPFAFSVEEHLSYCSGFKAWQISVNFQRRYYHSVMALREVIRSGIFGKLKAIRFTQGYFSLKGGSGYLSDASLSGGGVIAESAIHALDIILHITGASDVGLDSLKTISVRGIDYDSVFDSWLETGNSRIPVHCEISTLQNLDNGLELQFEQACLFSELSPDSEILVRGQGRHSPGFTLQGYDPGGANKGARRINEAFLSFWKQVAGAMQDEQVNPTSAAQCLLTTQWLEPIYQKIKSID